MGLEDWGLKYRVERLRNVRKDLCDDENSIRTINNRINEVIDDVQSFIRSGSGAITSKLNNLKEPYQSNDSDIINAREYVRREIEYLNRQIDD